MFDYPHFPKFSHTHNGDDTIPRSNLDFSGIYLYYSTILNFMKFRRVRAEMIAAEEQTDEANWLASRNYADIPKN